MRALLHFVFHLGYFGPVVMGVLDSSFLFLPFGNDLLVVAMTARHHQGYPWYVLGAVAGSTMGVFILDRVARKLGEAGIRRMAGDKKFDLLKRKIGDRGAIPLAVGCLAPPPFPFTMAVAVTSALEYPLPKLLLTVAAARAVRFLILGYLAIRYGRWILHVANSPAVKWSVGIFALLCIVGSVLSVMKWLRSREGKREKSHSQPQESR